MARARRSGKCRRLHVSRRRGNSGVQLERIRSLEVVWSRAARRTGPPGSMGLMEEGETQLRTWDGNRKSWRAEGVQMRRAAAGAATRQLGHSEDEPMGFVGSGGVEPRPAGALGRGSVGWMAVGDGRRGRQRCRAGEFRRASNGALEKRPRADSFVGNSLGTVLRNRIGWAWGRIRAERRVWGIRASGSRLGGCGPRFFRVRAAGPGKLRGGLEVKGRYGGS
jgi:hypothetical protein